MDAELKWTATSDLNMHNLDSNSAIETMVGTVVDKPSASAVETMVRSVDKPSASTNSSDAYVPHSEVCDIVEDPDIITAEDNILRANKRHVTSISESVVSEGERADSSLSNTSCDDPDKMDDRSDEVADDGGEEPEDKIRRNKEQEDVKIKKEEEKDVAEDLDKTLNPDASEFKPPTEVVPEHEELSLHPKGSVETKMTRKIVSVPDQRIQLIDQLSGSNISGM
jgi:hypothetical protein